MNRNLHFNYSQHYGLKPADRIVIPKSNLRIVQHHAIYLGFDSNNIEWIAENMIGEGVRIVKASDFFISAKEITRIEKFTGTETQRNDAIKRAIALKGSNYNLLTFNCEHYSNVVQHNKPNSNQVGQGFVFTILALIVAGILFSKDN